MLSERTERILALSREHALAEGRVEVKPEHLLSAMVEEAGLSSKSSATAESEIVENPES